VKTTPSTPAGERMGVRPRQETGSDKTIWFFLLALVILFWAPEFILSMAWPEYWIAFLTEVFMWALFAVAFNVLMGYTGMISFGQAAYLGIGGYTAGLLLKKLAWMPFWLGLVAAPVGGALAAAVIGFFCIRRTHIYFAILTLAFGQIVYLIAFKLYDFTGGDNGLIGVPVPAWVQDPTFSNYYKFVLVVVIAAIYVLWRIVNSTPNCGDRCSRKRRCSSRTLCARIAAFWSCSTLITRSSTNDWPSITAFPASRAPRCGWSSSTQTARAAAC
jgi:hypothetical protein